MSALQSLITTEYAKFDTAVTQWFDKVLLQLGDNRKTSPLLADLPLVRSPTPFVLLISFYFLVLAIFYPIVWFRQRRAAAAKSQGATTKTPTSPLLTRFVQFHNIFLALLSVWMGSSMIYYHNKLGYPIWGFDYDETRDLPMSLVMYVFYLSKYYEFFDTFIMLMKGNLDQITFLHVYHHASTCFVFWWVSNRAPGGDAWWIVTVNSWVHVIMYTYYFLTSVLERKQRAKYLWWGKYLTLIQMIQFAVGIIHSVFCIYYSPYSQFAVRMQIVDMTILLALFLNFYIRKHCLGDGEKEAETPATVQVEIKKKVH